MLISLQRVELKELDTIFEYQVKLTDKDIILSPVLTDRTAFFARKGTIIPFSAEGAIVLKNNESKKMYFGDDYKKYKRDNIKEYMYDYVIQDKPLDTFEKNLYENYIKNLKPNQRIVLMAFYGRDINPPQAIGMDLDNYDYINVPSLLFSKTTRDCYLVLDKYLKEAGTYYTSTGPAVVVFEKEN